MIDRDTADVFDMLVLLRPLTYDEREAFVDHRYRGDQLGTVAKRMVSKRHPEGLSRERVRQLVMQAERKIEAQVNAA